MAWAASSCNAFAIAMFSSIRFDPIRHLYFSFFSKITIAGLRETKVVGF